MQSHCFSPLPMDTLDSVGALQLFAGYTSGYEAAVHAGKTIFNSPKTEAFLTVDATNAFNSLNRRVALTNVMKWCPPLSRALINTYRSDTSMEKPSYHRRGSNDRLLCK